MSVFEIVSYAAEIALGITLGFCSLLALAMPFAAFFVHRIAPSKKDPTPSSAGPVAGMRRLGQRHANQRGS